MFKRVYYNTCDMAGSCMRTGMLTNWLDLAAPQCEADGMVMDSH